MVSHRIWHIFHLFFNMFLFQTVCNNDDDDDDDDDFENGFVMIMIMMMIVIMVKMFM